jgi:DNA sulfur modification protein DndC
MSAFGNASLFEGDRMLLAEAIELTRQSLVSYAPRYSHWAVAYSGGKDSSATVSIVAHLIETGQVPAPKSLTVLYADTRMELPPLHDSAMKMLAELRERGFETRVVLPALDDRYFVYMFGRGVPPPKNRFRWCTAQIKIEPMMQALQVLRDSTGQKLLMITGVRLGESAARDTRIVTSCSRDGAECGQGWFQEATPESIADTLAPLLHWRVCHVWAWLTAHAPEAGFPTMPVAIAYGADTTNNDVHARTGCIGCPLASRDNALRAVIRQPDWSYLEPLLRLKTLYEDLSFNHANRLRKAKGETLKDGSMAKNPQRVGPLTMDARRRALATVLDVQREINRAAEKLSRPEIDLINLAEFDRIIELIEANTWPDGWDGDEPNGSVMLDRIFANGNVQPLLMAELEGEA